MFFNKRKNKQPSKLSHSEERMQNYSELMHILSNIQNIDSHYVTIDNNVQISIDEILRYNDILHIGNVYGENPLVDVEFYSVELKRNKKVSINKITDKQVYNKLYDMYKDENEYRYDFENNCIRPEYLEAKQQEKDNFIPNEYYHVDKDKKVILVIGEYIKHCLSGGEETTVYWLNGFCHFLLQTVIENEWEINIENEDSFQSDFANYVLAICSKLVEENREAVVFCFDGEMSAGFIAS